MSPSPPRVPARSPGPAHSAAVGYKQAVQGSTALEADLLWALGNSKSAVSNEYALSTVNVILLQTADLLLPNAHRTSAYMQPVLAGMSGPCLTTPPSVS